MNTAQAIIRTLESPNVADSNLENANVVDVLQRVANSAGAIANAITPSGAGGRDAAGGYVASLTEAGMGIAAALVQISQSIDGLAEAIRERSEAVDED